VPSIGYFGPEGTFTHEALEAGLKSQYDREVPYSTIPEVFQAVQSGDVDRGIVPIENSIEGSVNVTLDMLAFESDLVIVRELQHPIAHCLLVRPGVKKEDIKRILSHPQPMAQCRGYLSRWFPDVPVTAANSTADAARSVSQSVEPVAAIGTELAAKIYGLEVLDRDLSDYPGNVTRFVVVGREKTAPSGRDKTSIVCFIQANRPGSLLEILQEFAGRGINLTKIESRPTKKVLGEYYFFMDIDGHVDDPEVAAAIGSLVGKLRELKLLGSYPA